MGGYQVAFKGGACTCMMNARLPDGMNGIIVLFITGVFHLRAEINDTCLEGRSGIVSSKNRAFVNTHVALIAGFEPMALERTGWLH